MSDARAKAEARRAKILAREMKVSALGTDDISLPLPSNTSVNKKIIVDINNTGDNVIVEGDTKIDVTDNSISPATTPSISIRERPIAARRHLIKSATLTTVSDSVNTNSDSIDNTAITTDSTGKNSSIVNHDDPEVESIEQFEKRDAVVPSSSSSSKSSPSKDSKSKLVIAKKTLKEIESEIAQNTAAFDAKTLSKGTTPDEKKDAHATTTDDDATALKKSQQQLKLNKLPSNIQPSSVMRLVRLVIIILLGLYQGYVVIRANNQVSKSSSNIIDSTEILQHSQPTFSSSRRETTATRTWSQWFISTLTSPFESSITAVGVAWWIASIVENTVAIRVCLCLCAYIVICDLIDYLLMLDMFDISHSQSMTYYKQYVSTS